MRRLIPLTCVLCALSMPAADTSPAISLRYGIANFGKVDPLKDVEKVAACGYDYIEPALSQAVALPPDALAAARKKVEASGLRVETMNWFMHGGDIKLTGPHVDREKIRAYLETALALADSFGAKVIVFGSPGARSAPEGFPKEKAWDQLKEFLRVAGEIIQTRNFGMVIGIEALRKPETNMINSVAEALRLAREVNHPKIRIIVDFYHLAFENENPDIVFEGRDMIVHLQIADPKARTFPKDEGGDARYAQFFSNLRRIGYQGRISIEANSDNVAQDCGPALAFLKKTSS
jgi:D-psicose/D-tagatose/L-ribulose 3-epimerase